MADYPFGTQRTDPKRCSTPWQSLRWTLREPRYQLGAGRLSRHTGPHRLCGCRRFTANIFLINQRGPPLLHHDFAIDDDGRHIASYSDVHQSAEGMESWCQVSTTKIEHNEVRLLPNLEASELVLAA